MTPTLKTSTARLLGSWWWKHHHKPKHSKLKKLREKPSAWVSSSLQMRSGHRCSKKSPKPKDSICLRGWAKNCNSVSNHWWLLEKKLAPFLGRKKWNRIMKCMMKIKMGKCSKIAIISSKGPSTSKKNLQGKWVISTSKRSHPNIKPSLNNSFSSIRSNRAPWAISISMLPNI